MERPDGSGQFLGGLAFLAVGAFSFIVSLFGDISTFSGIDFQVVLRRWALLSIAGASVSLAFMLFVTGWIIKAISFLPGRGEAMLTTDKPVLDLSNPVGSGNQDSHP